MGEEIVALRIKGKGSGFQDAPEDVPVPERFWTFCPRIGSSGNSSGGSIFLRYGQRRVACMTLGLARRFFEDPGQSKIGRQHCFLWIFPNTL
jgi:hypothetical protein